MNNTQNVAEEKMFVEAEIEIPTNVLKEKILYCLPSDSQIEDNAVVVMSEAVKHFLKLLAKKVPYEKSGEKKIMVKDIKTCIETEPVFSFLRKLTDK